MRISEVRAGHAANPAKVLPLENHPNVDRCDAIDAAAVHTLKMLHGQGSRWMELWKDSVAGPYARDGWMCEPGRA